MPVTPAHGVDDEIAMLLAASTPRRVSPRLAAAARRVAGVNWIHLLFGLFFGGFGAVFVWALFPWSLARDWQLQAADTVQTTGRIVVDGKTNVSMDDVSVWRYAFEFHVGAVRHRGECFTTGRKWSAKEVVAVRYRPEEPAIACVAGARLSEGEKSGMMTPIFPAVGFGLVAWVVTKWWRVRWLLEYGRVGKAEVVSIAPTKVSVNYQPVFKITLRLPGARDPAPLIVRCHSPAAVTFAETRLQAGEPVAVLYDPQKPKRILLPETLR